MRTIMSSSSWAKCGCIGSSAGEKNPPEDAILITSAPARITSRTFCAHAVDAVADAVGEPRVGQPAGADAAARQHLVVVAGGLAEHRDRDLHPRADQQAVVHRHAEPRVGATRVAHRRDAEPDRGQQVRRRLVEAVGERPVLDRELVVLIRAGQVHVGVEQPRQQRLARAVDALVAVEPRADLDDLPVLDHDVGVGERRHRAVEDLAPVEHRPGHSVPPCSCTRPTLRREPYRRRSDPGWTCD